MWVWVWGLYRGPRVCLAVHLCLLSPCLVVFVKNCSFTLTIYTFQHCIAISIMLFPNR